MRCLDTEFFCVSCHAVSKHEQKDPSLPLPHIPIIYCEIYLQTYRHDMTYSVLKVPLNPNQPTSSTSRSSRSTKQPSRSVHSTRSATGSKMEVLVVAMYANVKRLMQSAERTNCVRLSSLALRPLHFRPVVRSLQFQTSLKELELPGNVECSCSIRSKQFLSFKEKSQLLSIFILWTVFSFFDFSDLLFFCDQ